MRWHRPIRPPPGSRPCCPPPAAPPTGALSPASAPMSSTSVPSTPAFTRSTSTSPSPTWNRCRTITAARWTACFRLPEFKYLSDMPQPDSAAVAELRTLRDLLRYAVSRFHAARLSFGHGSDNAWDEAVYLLLHSLHLPPDTLQPFLDARVLAEERQRFL